MHVSSESRSSSRPDAGRYRQVSIGHPAVEVSEAQGILHMRSLEALEPLPARLLDRLVHWAGSVRNRRSSQPRGRW